MDEEYTEILHVVNKWSHGGVEHFIEGLAETFTSTPFSHSVLSLCTEVKSSAPFKGVYGPLYNGNSPFSILVAVVYFVKFLDRHHFDAVHIHASNGSCFLLATIARVKGIPIRIVHSHNSSLGAGSGVLKNHMHKMLTLFFSGNETVRLACSADAGKHLFGKRVFDVVPNGIDVSRFSFDLMSRNELRSMLNIGPETKMVLCVGSLVEAKNHKRAIAVFSRLTEMEPNSLLVILGDGPLRNSLEDLSEIYMVKDKVQMPGFVTDSERWLSAADVMLFPSLHEGLPIALVEAQCNGLPVVCSSSVTSEVALTDLVRFVSLESNDDDWANFVISAKRSERDCSSQVAKSGYSREETALKLINYYSELKDC